MPSPVKPRGQGRVALAIAMSDVQETSQDCKDKTECDKLHKAAKDDMAASLGFDLNTKRGATEVKKHLEPGAEAGAKEKFDDCMKDAGKDKDEGKKCRDSFADELMKGIDF